MQWVGGLGILSLGLILLPFLISFIPLIKRIGKYYKIYYSIIGLLLTILTTFINITNNLSLSMSLLFTLFALFSESWVLCLYCGHRGMHSLSRKTHWTFPSTQSTDEKPWSTLLSPAWSTLVSTESPRCLLALHLFL